MARIGLLGGTFDPPHNGHIAIAEAALNELDLVKIIFIPARIPPHKLERRISSESDRLAMLRLAVADRDRFEISEIEFGRPSLSYTAETVAELKRIYHHDELYFLIGADNISEMEGWHLPERIFELVRVAAAGRLGFAPEGRFAKEIISFEMPPVDISSTRIREMIRLGEPISGLVPKRVEEFIKNYGLYSGDE